MKGRTSGSTLLPLIRSISDLTLTTGFNDREKNLRPVSLSSVVTLSGKGATKGGEMFRERNEGFNTATRFLVDVALLVLLIIGLAKIVVPELKEAMLMVTGDEVWATETRRNSSPNGARGSDMSGGH